MAKIFVSYRRSDSASETGRIVEHLSRHFGESEVFNDVFDIQGGQNFKELIHEELNGAKVLLVVIGNDWVSALDDAGNRRLDSRDDFVHFEVATGLAITDCTVIPVLVNGQPIPKKDELPEAMRDLVDRNAVHIRPDPDFAKDTAKLSVVVSKYVQPRRKWPARVALVAGMLAFAVAVFYFGWRDPPDTIIQAFDSSTGARISRPFEIKFAGEDVLPSADSQYVMQDTKPIELEIAKVDCEGFQQFTTKDGSTETTRSGKDIVLKILLERSEEYLDAIKPDIDTVVGLPGDAQINDAVSKGESVAPENFELFVDNSTEDYVDVLLYWLPPSNTEVRPFDARWSHIQNRAIPPGKRISVKGFGFKPGYFVFFASVQAKRGVMLDSFSLYRKPFALINITEPNPNGISIDYFSSRPTDASLPLSSD